MPGFVPLPQDASPNELSKGINRAFERLDGETVTKTFRQAGGNAIVQGKLPYGKYGTLLYDTDGTPAGLFAQAPNDGRPGLWITKKGKNVITELGG